MKQFGKLTNLEQLEFNDLVNRNLAVQSLIQRLLIEETEYNKKREEWFDKIRRKYEIPDTASIALDEQYNILEQEVNS